jgi:spore coat protein U-like protein
VNKRVLVLLLAFMASPTEAFITCQFNSTPALAFGAYDDSSGVATNGATTVVVRCTRIGGANSANVTVQIGPGQWGGVPARQMRSGANPMNYNLYRDAARTLVWGQTAGVDALTLNVGPISNGASLDANFTIYGRIPALQNVPAGTYTDSVQLTVSP